MRSRMFVLALAVVAIACSDVTGPGTRHAVSIVGITTPAHATPADTIRISFYVGASPCDTGVVVTSERTSDGIRFSASSVITRSEVCTLADAALTAPVPFVFAAPPPHPLPFVARFAQPGAPDSVRTVQP